MAPAREREKEEAQMLAEALLDAEVRIGELTRDIPVNPGNEKKQTDSAVAMPTKSSVITSLGFVPKQVERFESLASHLEIVEQVNT